MCGGSGTDGKLLGPGGPCGGGKFGGNCIPGMGPTLAFRGPLLSSPGGGIIGRCGCI